LQVGKNDFAAEYDARKSSAGNGKFQEKNKSLSHANPQSHTITIDSSGGGGSDRSASDKVLNNYGYEMLDALISIQLDFLADEHTPSKRPKVACRRSRQQLVSCGMYISSLIDKSRA
jgi:hypothetical protein